MKLETDKAVQCTRLHKLNVTWSSSGWQNLILPKSRNRIS